MPKCRPLQLNITCGCPICPYHGTALFISCKLRDQNAIWSRFAAKVSSYALQGHLLGLFKKEIISNVNSYAN